MKKFALLTASTIAVILTIASCSKMYECICVYPGGEQDLYPVVSGKKSAANEACNKWSENYDKEDGVSCRIK